MKKVTLVVIQTALGVSELIREKLKEKALGLVYELKFGKSGHIRLDTFLEVPEGKEFVIFVNNPFQSKDYLGSQSFETWIDEIAKGIDDEAKTMVSSFMVFDEEYFHREGISQKRMEIIFRDELNILKKIHTNMPYSGSFDPQQATDSIFFLNNTIF
ncbi:MAG: hypothetical protein WCW54_03435 [Candidatus Paceibacterota bacterium]|jgi:hypothetical protein